MKQAFSDHNLETVEVQDLQNQKLKPCFSNLFRTGRFST